MTLIDRRQLLQAGAGVAAAAALGQPPWTGPALADGRTAPHQDLGEPQSLDGRPFPAYDYSRANKLPREMTGYWTTSFDVAGQARTAKVYISAETPIRSYFTVIAVPDGVDTATFLEASSWRDVADRRGEGLFVLEPGADGWTSFQEEEAAYVDAAMAFYQSNRYFSVFGLHYLVGYGGGAAPLESWAVAHPLRVIAQVYIDSPGLSADYLSSYAAREFDGTTDTGYTTVVFPEGFHLIRYDETVLPTWYIHPDRRSIGASLAYWKCANDTTNAASWDHTLGTVYRQRRGSDRWMTSHAGPISQVAVQDRRLRPHNAGTSDILGYLTGYTRYENFFAYGNQLFERADYARLGIQVRTMMVEGFIREYLVYVPTSTRRLWRDKAPVLFVWPGNSQTDKVFLDATQWWKVAESEGFLLAMVCEQYSNTSVSVSHRDSNAFFRQLRDVMLTEYRADPSRFYSTGQSAGSQVTQSFAIAFPEYFAAVATTSFPVAPDASGSITMDGVAYPASGQSIPNYMIYGYGDLSFLAGTLWDDVSNGLDSWAEYNLRTNGLTLADVDTVDGRFSGFHKRFQTWTWRDRGTAIPVFKVTKDVYRSHNTIAEEESKLWDFLKHYSREIDDAGDVVRYYSESGFRRPRDRRRI